MTVPDVNPPPAMVKAACTIGTTKANLPVNQMIIRGTMSGMILGYATSLSITTWTQPFGKECPILGAVFFPVGFVMLVMCGFELVTGNMATIPMAIWAGRTTWGKCVNNFLWVTIGNLIGAVSYAFLFWGAFSFFGWKETETVAHGVKAMAIAEAKTIKYVDAGFKGWLACFCKGIMCNWMVSMGVIMNIASNSVPGKIMGMWLPIFTFFAHGVEHAIVNFYVIPCGMLFGAETSFYQWWIWNQVPVILGNFVGASCITAYPLFASFPCGPEN